MVSEERLLFEERDEYGVIRVIESGDYRFLEFGDGVEQSCVFMPDPAWLEYDYTRAMLLGALCHSQPRRALFLGFGAGSLTQACLRHLPLEEAEAIELRPAIPRLAREHLGLRDDPRLRLRIGDALESLGECAEADLIFLDLYTDTGPSAAHLAWNFLGACQERLAEDGWLVINQWSGTDGKPLGAPLLRGRYHHHYWECPVAEGNVVMLVPANLALELDQEALRTRAAALEPQLGYSLQGYIDSLRPAQ
ncbi:spermidine synthase [Pseudomonas aeruginosa]|uniref:spermidine synthase n=1 Tax=Pseudomonas aeruginosa TaxID=287 RepID=UPI0021F0FF77|nr:spermidine synthase [Pseudomonas aeruginosa]MCV4110993.1 spermidine synthase [Pseudomonas aeruginosa]MCV4247748.1 spermidine synthase [Pseudomonas aeruginosa]MCV4249297.1 spermidine synthase [Pseudomonas aeruginosa]